MGSVCLLLVLRIGCRVEGAGPSVGLCQRCYGHVLTVMDELGRTLKLVVGTLRDEDDGGSGRNGLAERGGCSGVG